MRNSLAIAQQLTLGAHSDTPCAEHAVLMYGHRLDVQAMAGRDIARLRGDVHDLSVARGVPIALIATSPPETDGPFDLCFGVLLAASESCRHPALLSSSIFDAPPDVDLALIARDLVLDASGAAAWLFAPAGWCGVSVVSGSWSEDLGEELEELAEDGEDPQTYLREEHEWGEGDLEGLDLVTISSEDSQPVFVVTSERLEAFRGARDPIHMLCHTI